VVLGSNVQPIASSAILMDHDRIGEKQVLAEERNRYDENANRSAFKMPYAADY
jgi:hypothetical protein